MAILERSTFVLITCFLVYGTLWLPLTTGGLIPSEREDFLSVASTALGALLKATTQSWCSVVLVTDGTVSSFAIRKVLEEITPLSGTQLFETTRARDQSLNKTREQLSFVISEATRLWKSYKCVIVMAASGDYQFLETFAGVYNFDLLLAWKQRPIIITNLALEQLTYLLKQHWVLFATNAMVVHVQDISKGKRWIEVYSHLPFSPEEGGQVVRIATWSPFRGIMTSPQPKIFPNKSERSTCCGSTVSVKEALKNPITLYNLLRNPRTFRFKEPVSVVIAVEHWFPHVMIRSTGNGGSALEIGGSMANLLEALAQSLNFTHKLVRPRDGEWGSKKPDGSWSGMVGLVLRQEADIALGPHDLTEERSTVIDYTSPIYTDARKFVVGQSRAEVNPWGFLLPLSPKVWVGVIMAFGTIAVITLMIGSNYRNDPPHTYFVNVVFHTFRLLLQQGLTMKLRRVPERTVVCGWLIGAMIITWSYSTNLMSILAVRYAPKPIQTIQDLLDNDGMTVIFTPNTALTDYIENVDGGLLKELVNLRKVGRYKDVHFTEFPAAMGTLVKRGDHVIATDNTDATRLIANYFSKTGTCNFYIAREAFVPFVMGMIGQKGSPLLNAISYRIRAMSAGGLYRQWLGSNFANSTACRNMPSRFTVKEPFTLTNIWGMFVLLASGLALAGAMFCLEFILEGRYSSSLGLNAPPDPYKSR